MATLTTVEGLQIIFSPKAVLAIADHDSLTGQAVTCVYGIAQGELHISETVPAFVTRLGVTKDFVQLTRPNGSPVWINGSWVSAIRAPLPKEYPAGVKAVVSALSLTQAVKETPADVKTAINALGVDL